MQNVLKVTARNVYGRPVYYPACDKARALARIAGTKTLTAAVIREARNMGIRVDVQTDSLDPNRVTDGVAYPSL